MRERRRVGLGLRCLLLAGLLAMGVATGVSRADAGTTRHYYVAVEEVLWDFAPTGRDLVGGGPVPQPWRDHTRWRKARYIQYADETFTVRVPQPSWLGILGPCIRAEVGDRVKLHVLNRTADFQAIHAQGIRVLETDAAFHAGGRALVAPGGALTYTWVVDAESGPAPGAPSSVVRWYGAPAPEGLSAHLLGPAIIARAGTARADASPEDVDREFVVLLKVFDQARGYGKGLMHSINGYIFGNLPGLIALNGERVRWHILDLGSENAVKASLPFAVPANMTASTKGFDTVRLSSGAMTVTDMRADDPGTFALRGHEPDHVSAGMAALYTVVP